MKKDIFFGNVSLAQAQVDFLLTQANILQVEKEEERAHTLVEKAISVASKARYPATLVDTLNMGVAIAIKQKRFDIANQYADRAIELTLNLHQYLDPQHFGPAWSGKTHELFANKINLLIKNTESTSSDTHAKIFKLLEQSATISIRRSTKSIPRPHRQSTNHISIKLASSKIKELLKPLPH
jgi:tetratricopeptide (TPR) repeat protein